MKDRTTMAGREAALERELARKAQQARKRRRRPVPVPETDLPPQRRTKSLPMPPKPPGSPIKPDVGKMTEQLKKLGGAKKKGPTTKLPPGSKKAPPTPRSTKSLPMPQIPGPIGSKKAPPTPRRKPTGPRRGIAVGERVPGRSDGLKMPPKPKVDPNRSISVADFERSGGLGKGPAKGTPKKPKQEPVMTVPGTRTPTTKTGKGGGMYDKYPQRPGDFKKGGAVGGAKKKSKAKIRGAGIERKGLRKAKIR